MMMMTSTVDRHRLAPKSNYYRVNVYTEKLLVEMDAGIYFFINQGCLTVDNMDDKAEMQCVEV